jgi:hypothetical protein
MLPEFQGIWGIKAIYTNGDHLLELMVINPQTLIHPGAQCQKNEKKN